MAKLNLKFTVAFCLLFPLCSVVIAAGNVAEGKKSAEKCVECHGLNGEGIAPKTKLAGLKAAAFKKAMKEYKAGTEGRTHPVMMQIAKKLTDKETADLAAYYAGK